MSKPVELWTPIAPAQDFDPRAAAEAAAQLEAEGWDGGTVADTQCITVDPYVTMALCAARTTRLKLQTGVTNTLTRHPAVTASAFATLQAASGGRAVMGISRGDSALAYLGGSPQPIDRFERSLQMIQAYLRGEGVPVADAAEQLTGTRKGYEDIALGAAPPQSWLKWLANVPAYTKVPIEVAATGPKAIAIAARTAEQVMFMMGAEPDRLRWAVRAAREAAEKAGRDPASLRLGAWVLLYPHDDIAVGRRLAAPGAATAARFLTLNRTVVGPVSDSTRATLKRVAETYDMTHHATGGPQAEALDPAFLDSFAILGPASRCVERLEEILDLGFDKLIVSVGSVQRNTALGLECRDAAVGRVLPAIGRLRRSPNGSERLVIETQQGN
jgi:5,10-methylenetetrahydromethanopterin reductase